MDSSTHNLPPEQPRKKIAAEFATWPMNDTQVKLATKIREMFSDLQGDIELIIPSGNQRYLALTKTKLEEACMFAVKGIAKPAN